MKLLMQRQGQALTEFALSLTLFALSFFALDFLLALNMAQNRAEIYQHHLLFRAYRESEHSFQALGPHPDPLHLIVSEQNEGFSGRVWFHPAFAKNTLFITYQPHFPSQAKFFGNFAALPYAQEAKILRDPWDDHPIKYVSWGIAIAQALAQGGGSESSQSGETKQTQNTSASLDQDLSQAPGGAILQEKLKEVTGLTGSGDSDQQLDLQSFLKGSDSEQTAGENPFLEEGNR